MGGVIIGILVVTIVSIIAGQQKFGGIFDVPPSIAPVFLQMDLAGALQVGLVTVVFAFLFVDLFDNTGTLIALAHRGGFMRPDGTVPRLQPRPDVRQRGGDDRRRGRHLDDDQLHRERVGHQRGRPHRTDGASRSRVLFLLALFIAPLAGSIPPYATAPALLYVACLMTRGLRRGRVGRHHRSGARGDHRDRDALHLLDRRRHRVRLHLLRRHQAGRRHVLATSIRLSEFSLCCS